MLFQASLTAAAAVLGFCTSVQAQVNATFVSSNSTFNSTYHFTAEQKKAANLTDMEANNLEYVLNFERSMNANGGPSNDDFYRLPPLVNGTIPPAGTLLKVQEFTDPTPFNLAPNLAMSRILYTTTNLNGTVIPASAYVLWPFQPKQFKNSPKICNVSEQVAPVALFNHGTSGFFQNSAPSSLRTLWYEYWGPFPLALAGYAVVAPDYAGLGIDRTWNGTYIGQQYIASPAAAHDGLYALQAAHKAFPGKLDKRFVSIGNSNGGGVSWGTAELLLQHPELGPGYLGAIAMNPTTQLFYNGPGAVFVSAGVETVYPTFNMSQWLTPEGVARYQLAKQVQGGDAFSAALTTTSGALVKPGYNETWYAMAYGKLANAGRKNFTGPLLVIQGSLDPQVLYPITNGAVEDTARMFPDADLTYWPVNGTTHVPTMHATQHMWLQWIEDRFEGNPTKGGYTRTDINSWLPIGRYKTYGNRFLSWAEPDSLTYERRLGQ